MITPRSARRAKRKELSDYAVRQLATIIEALGRHRREDETPAMAVKRIVAMIPDSAEEAEETKAA